MSMIGKVLNKPAWSIAFWLLVAALGVISYQVMPVDLFPDTVPPQIVTTTVVPGASAEDVNRRVTTLIDRELRGLTGIKNVVSTSRDEVSSVNAQFEYGVNVAAAMTDVINAVSRVTRQFPSGTQASQFFRITDANRPVLTLALSPTASSTLDLKAIRILAENDIKESLLRLPGVGKVDVFGANKAEVLVRMDIEKLRQFKISPEQVLRAIGSQNLSLPGGYLDIGGRESLVKTLNEARTPQELAELPMRVQKGGVIKLADVASVTLDVSIPRSIYHGNGRPAIALNILKPENGYAVGALQSVKAFLPELQQKYSEIEFAVTTDQEPIISVNIVGMKDALFSAVWLTMLIVLILLQNLSAAIIVGVSIPLAFLSAFAFLYFTPFTINMVTLSGLIIAVGMVVDAAIVVVENSWRHLSAEKHSLAALIKGVEEVIFSISGGMLTTIVVMIPIMFVGGYAQQVLRPLSMTISATLIGSFIAAITVVPLLLRKMAVAEREEDAVKIAGTTENALLRGFYRQVDRLLEFITAIYLKLLRIGLRMRWALIISSAVLLIITLRLVLPMIGRELMPRMDTGMITVKADLPPSTDVVGVEAVINRMQQVIKKNEHVLSISTVAGAEPGQVSFGAGGQLLQQLDIQVRLTTRDKRDQNIWQIMGDWREEFALIPELINYSVTEFGATPMATSKAPLDVLISGRDPDTLFQIANSVENSLRKISGLNDLRLSWSKTKPETHFLPDLILAARYQLTPQAIGEFLGLTLTGRTPSALKMHGFIDLGVRVELGNESRRWRDDITQLFIPGTTGDLYLGSLGKKYDVLQPTLVTRENLQETIDILGINSVRPLSAVAADVEEKLAELRLPDGYSAKLTGSMSDMADTGMRLAKALLFAFVFLYVVLYLLFENWWRPFLVMAAIPLSLIGAFWGLLIFDKPMCMPAMMGIILLGGTIVNNAIILIDFIDTSIAAGMPRQQALFESVKTRLRPILITTLSTILGLMPLTFESAVGLERMSPLGIVASFGLLAGTLMTMVIIPVLYDLVCPEKSDQ